MAFGMCLCSSPTSDQEQVILTTKVDISKSKCVLFKNVLNEVILIYNFYNDGYKCDLQMTQYLEHLNHENHEIF